MASEYAFRGRIISVRALATPKGRREIVEHPGAVATVVEDDEGRVLLVRQLREAAGRKLWEIPAGKLEPGESPQEAARRELEEETGLRASTLQPLGTIYASPGYSTEKIFLYLAQGVEGTPAAGTEVNQVRFFSREEIVSLAQAGAGDGKTLAALALLELRKQGGKQPA